MKFIDINKIYGKLKINRLKIPNYAQRQPLAASYKNQNTTSKIEILPRK